MKTSSLIASAVATVVAAPLLANADPAPEPAFKAEKCYGIAAAARTIAAPPAIRAEARPTRQ